MKRKDKPHPLAFLGPPFFEFLGLDPRTHALLLSTSQGARSAPLDPRVEARGTQWGGSFPVYSLYPVSGLYSVSYHMNLYIQNFYLHFST